MDTGRCHLEEGNFSEAKECAEKALRAAMIPEDAIWQLNATVLIAKCERMYLQIAFNSMCFHKPILVAILNVHWFVERTRWKWQYVAVKMEDYQLASESFTNALELAKAQGAKDAEKAIERVRLHIQCIQQSGAISTNPPCRTILYTANPST